MPPGLPIRRPPRLPAARLAPGLLALLLGAVAGPAGRAVGAAPSPGEPPGPWSARWSAALRDLDVAIPPGSPLDWGRSFPAFTPPRRSLLARSPGSRPGDAPVSRSVPAGERLEVRIGSSNGLVRVLTWDLAAHLEWMVVRREEGPLSGAPARMPPRPAYGDGLYWVSLAPLLRLLLHPGLVSEAETAVHLVEIGSWVEGVLDAAGGEKGLAATVALVRERVRPQDASAPIPLEPLPAAGATVEGAAGGADQPSATRGRMLSRFLLEELLRQHPYDPEGRFGEHIFLFAEELEPWLVRYAGHGASFPRRNAVAALARYETRTAAEALLALAATTQDPVVLVRALAGLGRFRAPLDAAPLVERLGRTEDPLERVSLIGALGRLGHRAAVPRLLELGAEGLEARDGDLVLAILDALCLLRDGGNAAALVAFADEVSGACARLPRAWRRDAPAPTVLPDALDPPEQRATVLAQHALLLRQRCRPDDPGVRAELLALLDQNELPSWASEATARGLQRYVGSRLARVVPSARFLFVEGLAWVGDPSARALLLVAEDPRVEEALRGHALGRLPAELRADRLAEVLARRDEDPALRLQAFGLLEREGDARLAELAHALLRECAAQAPGAAAPELRYLFLSAVRALDERRELRAEELVPLLDHVRAPLQRAGDLPARLEELIGRAADLAAGGAKLDLVREAVGEVVEVALAAGINPDLTEDTRRELRELVLGQLAGLRARPGDVEYRGLVVRTAVGKLLGTPLPLPNRLQGEFLPAVPLEEEIVLALGRTRAPMAVEHLAALLGERASRLLPHVALAVGMAGQPSLAPRLAQLLLDERPLVRFCAAEALASLTGVAEDVDWMFAPGPERFAAAERVWGRLQEER